MAGAWLGARKAEAPAPPAPVNQGEPLSEERELLQRELAAAREARAEAESRLAEAERRLTELAGLTREEALSRLLDQERGRNLGRLEQLGALEWDKLAASRLTTCMQRLASGVTGENTLSTVALPSDDMKGRIIGKEGRNLRHFEAATGVDVLIDDVPGSVSLSCFDPVRRELARIALTQLVRDGRISAPRIDGAVDAARAQLDAALEERGREAAARAGVAGLKPDLVAALGRLWLRSSYRQNVLDHSVEVSDLCASLAAELSLDVEVSRRAGLLHDIGKGMPEGGPSHARAGATLCRAAGESPAVCHAVEAHHHEVPQNSPEAALVTVADAISASRPGARRESSQTYLQRLERLEQVALSLPGVQECQVVQAGREVRALVRPDEVDDAGCGELVRELTARLEALGTPGPVRVTVLRSFQASGAAR